MKWNTKLALICRAILNSFIIYEKNTSDMPKLTTNELQHLRHENVNLQVQAAASDTLKSKVNKLKSEFTLNRERAFCC